MNPNKLEGTLVRTNLNTLTASVTTWSVLMTELATAINAGEVHYFDIDAGQSNPLVDIEILHTDDSVQHLELCNVKEMIHFCPEILPRLTTIIPTKVPRYKNAAQWLRELNEAGLMFHLDNEAADIIRLTHEDQLSHPIFTDEEALLVDVLVDQVFKVFNELGLDPFDYILNRLTHTLAL